MRTNPSFSSALALFAVLAAFVAGACSSSSSAEPAKAVEPAVPDASVAPENATYLTSEPQRPGDPEKGRSALLNTPYVPCGFPLRFASVAPGATDRLAGRDAKNADLPYAFTAMTTKDGVELATSNCLSCHAGKINGELVVGLGDAAGDFTRDRAGPAGLLGSILTDPKELAEFNKWKERIDAVAPYSLLSTRGPNPADNFTLVLFAHHDPKTMAWTSEPQIALPAPVDLPVDVPPWWHMKKKAAMFYTAAGRGDHARIMMTASILCTNSVEESAQIDSYFPDVRAYIASIVPPKYPFAIDRALAETGRGVFEKTCARCHGTYGDQGAFPNRLVPLDEIGTDPMLASGGAQFEKRFVDWFNGSFFGQLSRFEPAVAYVAPPLDGIWASAPYLHNGSVPTVAALLESSTRPQFWTRNFKDSKDYDPSALGWKFKSLSQGKAAQSNAPAKAETYDTTLPGYSNGGHTFGDVLTAAERLSVLEYLKTL